MATTEPIQIRGMSEFVRNLKKIDGDLPKAVRLAANESANVVVRYAKPKVPRGTGPGGRAASTVRAKSTRTAARVSGGSKKHPHYPWLDFGGRVGRNRSVRRPFIKEGRYIWATYSERYEEVWRTLHGALIDVARQSGVEVDE